MRALCVVLRGAKVCWLSCDLTFHLLITSCNGQVFGVPLQRALYEHVVDKLLFARAAFPSVRPPR